MILHPDLELAVTGHLRTALAADSLFVSNTLPTQLKPLMAIVEDHGGPRLDVKRKRNRVTVTLWATSRLSLNTQCARVEAVMVALPETTDLIRVSDGIGWLRLAPEGQHHRRFASWAIDTSGFDAV